MNIAVVHDNLMEHIISNLEAEGCDYSSNLVVFPNKRLAHFLRKDLSKKENRPLIPPRILSIDEFVDLIYEERLGLSRRKLDAMDAVAILYDIHRLDNRLSKGHFLSTDSFFSLGLKIYQDLEELFIEKVNPEMVKCIDFISREMIPEKTLGRLQALSFFYTNFYREIDKRGFSTRASRYRTVSERIREAGLEFFKRIIFSGFFALTSSEKEIFREISNLDGSLFIFQDGKGLEDRLKQLGIGKYQSPLGFSSIPKINIYKSPDTHGQVFALSNILRESLSKGEVFDEKTVIVLPSSETLFPLMHHCLSLLREDQYNISIGYSLYRTPIFGFLDNLMDLILSMNEDSFYVPDYLRFVLHPYVKNIYFNGRADITRILFHTIEEILTNNKTKTFLKLDEIEENTKLLRTVRDKAISIVDNITDEEISEHLSTIHKNTIKKFINFENISDFSRKCKDVLAYIYSNSTARLHPLFYPFSEAFIRAIDSISISVMKDISFEDMSSYFNLFKRYIRTCQVPFLGTPLRGLQVLGILETRNIQFDRVFILDLNEDIMPDIRKEDTLLPYKAREILGLPTYRDREKLTNYHFDLLMKGAKEMHLFFVENNKKEMSRFIQKLIWDLQKRDLEIKEDRYIKSIQYEVRLSNKTPLPLKKTTELIEFLKGYSYSATSLDIYLKCGLRFYYEYVLNLDKKDAVTGEIEKTDIGQFVHMILAEYFKQMKGITLNENHFDLKLLDNIVDTLFEERYKMDSGAGYLLKRQIKNRMRDLFLKYYVPLVKNNEVKILDIERKINISKDSFDLKGRLDRIEERDGRIFIIDYKTSANSDYLRINFDKLNTENREDWCELIGSLQLPFYHMLYVEHSKKKKEDINCAFLLLGRAAIDNEIERPLFNDDDDVIRKYRLMNDIIFKLLSEITDIDYPFLPARNMKEICKYCDFRCICGTL